MMCRVSRMISFPRRKQKPSIVKTVAFKSITVKAIILNNPKEININKQSRNSGQICSAFYYFPNWSPNPVIYAQLRYLTQYIQLLH